MNASTPMGMLTCSKHRNIYLNSSVDAWWEIECGKQYGKENRKELSSHAVEDYIHPSIYVQGHFTGESDLGYVACGDRFVLAYTNNTTLQQAWQCGVLDSLPVSRSAASHTLKASLMMYLLLLVGYFVYE